MGSNRTRSSEIRSRLSHPIIDSDGHIAEFEPALFDYLEQEAGSAMADRVRGLVLQPAWYRATAQERLANRITRPTWWAHPARNTLDRATSSLPRLLHRRLDDFGLDVAIIYPSMGLFPIHFDETEVRLAMCRAFNRMQADIFREYRNRLIPVAIIPMHTPIEAIAEAEYAVKTLGFKAILMPAYVRRPLDAVAKTSPELARHASWYDNFCIDSLYDYDPVWAKCLELKLSPTFHSPTSGLNMRATVSNFVFNHIGHFAAGGEVICKALTSTPPIATTTRSSDCSSNTVPNMVHESFRVKVGIARICYGAARKIRPTSTNLSDAQSPTRMIFANFLFRDSSLDAKVTIACLR
jgi:hypothetical protein